MLIRSRVIRQVMTLLVTYGGPVSYWKPFQDHYNAVHNTSQLS